MSEELTLDQSIDASMDETMGSLSGDTEQSDGAPPATPSGDSISSGGEGSPPGATDSPPSGGSPPPAEPPADFPKSWRKELAPHWNNLPPEVKAEVAKREQDVAAGFSQYSQAARFGQNLYQAIAPYTETIQQHAGGNPAAAVAALFEAEARLRNGSPEQRQAYLLQLAQTYGIPLPGQDPDRPAIDPTVQALMQDVTHLKGALTAQQRVQISALREEVSKQIDSFIADPKHAYFAEVQDDILKLVNAGYTLDAAYDAAVWANPVTRQKELNKSQEATKQKLLEEERKKAEAARKAGASNVRGRDTTKTPTEPLGSLDDTLNETLAEIKSRT